MEQAPPQRGEQNSTSCPQINIVLHRVPCADPRALKPQAGLVAGLCLMGFRHRGSSVARPYFGLKVRNNYSQVVVHSLPTRSILEISWKLIWRRTMRQTHWHGPPTSHGNKPTKSQRCIGYCDYGIVGRSFFTMPLVHGLPCTKKYVGGTSENHVVFVNLSRLLPGMDMMSQTWPLSRMSTSPSSWRLPEGEWLCPRILACVSGTPSFRLLFAYGLLGGLKT